MNQVESVIEAVVSLFIIFIFVAIVFPALGQATGSNTFLTILALIILAIGVIVSILKGR